MNSLAKIDDAALCSIELEQELLGSVVISNIAATVLEREVSASDFSASLHSQICEAICRVHSEQGSVSPSLIIAAMGGDASVIVADGTTLGQYIAGLAAAACVPGLVKAYAKQLREFANRRKLLEWRKRCG
jgi:replicative DNA helicase